MNYAELRKQIQILLVDETQAGAMCGKVSVFKELRDAYQIKPVIRRNSVVLYDVDDIRAAVKRKKIEG